MIETERHFSIGVIDVSLRSNLEALVEEYASLYGPYTSGSPTEDSIPVSIHARRRIANRWGPFRIQGDDEDWIEVGRHHQVLPHLEWMVNWGVIRRRHDLVQIHAATLERDGKALILPGEPGSGKTTLAAGLLKRGWSYLSDEFALIEPGTGRVQPFPRAMCVKEPSFAVMRRLGVPLRCEKPYQKATKGRVAFLNPLDVRPDAVGSPAVVRWVVFPRFVSGAQPRQVELPRSRAVFDLARQCFNLHMFQGRGVSVLAALIRRASCHRMISGDIEATCDLIETICDADRVAPGVCPWPLAACA